MVMTDEELSTAKKVVVVVVSFFLIYVVASWGGYIPDEYNVFRIFEEEEPIILADGYGVVEGFPTTVNVTAQENNSYVISFSCNESYVTGMELSITLGGDLENTTAYWTATSTSWDISADNLTAEYDGDALSNGVEISDLILHIDGGDAEDEIDILITTTVGELTPDEVTIDVVL